MQNICNNPTSHSSLSDPIDSIDKIDKQLNYLKITACALSVIGWGIAAASIPLAVSGILPPAVPIVLCALGLIEITVLVYSVYKSFMPEPRPVKFEVAKKDLEDNWNNKISMLTYAAEEGNKEACYELGIYYLNGTGVKQDFVKAQKLLETAANSGHLEASLALPQAYYLRAYNFFSDLNSLGVDRLRLSLATRPETVKKFNEIRGSNLIPIPILNEEQVEEAKKVLYFYDKQQADLYQKAADAGHAKAQLEFAKLRYKAAIVEEAKAESYLQKAIDQGLVEAEVELGLLYLFRKTPESQKLAVELFEKAAKKGNDMAGFHYGMCLMAGEGCKVDKELSWY